MQRGAADGYAQPTAGGAIWRGSSGKQWCRSSSQFSSPSGASDAPPPPAPVKALQFVFLSAWLHVNLAPKLRPSPLNLCDVCQTASADWLDFNETSGPLTCRGPGPAPPASDDAAYLPENIVRVLSSLDFCLSLIQAQFSIYLQNVLAERERTIQIHENPKDITGTIDPETVAPFIIRQLLLANVPLWTLGVWLHFPQVKGQSSFHAS